MGAFRRSAFVKAYLKQDEPGWFLDKHLRAFSKRTRKFRLLHRRNYLNLLSSEWNRMRKHPTIWWANQYWILNGGTDRKFQLVLRQLDQNPRPRKSRIAAKLASLRRINRG